MFIYYKWHSNFLSFQDLYTFIFHNPSIIFIHLDNSISLLEMPQLVANRVDALSILDKYRNPAANSGLPAPSAGNGLPSFGGSSLNRWEEVSKIWVFPYWLYWLTNLIRMRIDGMSCKLLLEGVDFHHFFIVLNMIVS